VQGPGRFGWRDKQVAGSIPYSELERRNVPKDQEILFYCG